MLKLPDNKMKIIITCPKKRILTVYRCSEGINKLVLILPVAGALVPERIASPLGERSNPLLFLILSDIDVFCVAAF